MLDKIKNSANTTVENFKQAKDASIRFGKKFIRKKAIENIREKLEFAEKDERDFAKEQMRKMISKEQKKYLKVIVVKCSTQVLKSRYLLIK